MSLVNGKRQAAWFDADPEVETEGAFAGVVFNRPMDQVLTYRVPERLRGVMRPGQRVRVPLGRGNQPAVGYCVRVDAAPPDGVEPGRVKDLLEVLDDPPLIDAAMLELTRWMAGYYACSWGQALDAVVPAGVKKQAGTRVGTFLIVPEEVRRARESLELPPKQAEALADPLPVGRAADALRPLPDGPVRPRPDRRACGSGATSTRSSAGSARRGRPRWSASPRPTPRRPRPRLTAEQAVVLERLDPALRGDAFATFLIHGVTGSGKTEVYLSAIEQVVARGREAIVLVPEISLTPQTIRRFRRRFDRVAVLHSHLSDAERHRHWQSIASGEVQVVVGARSAVFAPARRLGLIVIDEEHESTFKQETTPALPRPRRRRQAGAAGASARSCSARPRRRWRPGATPSSAATPGCRCASASAPGRCRGRADRPPPRDGPRWAA